MAIVEIALSALTFIWQVLKSWLFTLAVPFIHLETLWIIVPIWLSWFFCEFFQEKRGTNFGNAISNGVVPFWVGIDWIRQITTQLRTPEIAFSWGIFGKFAIAAILMLYGVLIIYLGVKGKEFVKYIGRIREVTYFLVMFTPFIYGLIKPTIYYWISIVVFFPLFYFAIELIDRDTKDSAVVQKDSGEAKPGDPFSAQGGPLPKF
ncbi:MAG: hypothetical protein V1735_08165 [Nanoarchaeota archaeon]